jgi:ion channel POLLUX/CASTOR
VIASSLSEDDNTIRLSGRTDYGVDTAAIREPAMPTAAPEHTLILGWNSRLPWIISELDQYVAAGSTAHVVAAVDQARIESARLELKLERQTVSFQAGETTDRRILDGIDLAAYQHVIVLSYSEDLDAQAADARTLITLLHLRDIADRSALDLRIVSEMLDERNRELAQVTRADDFIVSDKLVSLMLTQLAENGELEPVFADLLDPTGSEIYLKPVADYVELRRPVNFYTVVEAARRRGQVAIGYRVHAKSRDATRAYGVHVNPCKANTITFAEGDHLIVLAEE